MTRGHGWSLTITMRGTFTPYSLPAFTGAFDLTLLFLDTVGEISERYGTTYTRRFNNRHVAVGIYFRNYFEDLSRVEPQCSGYRRRW